MKIAFIGTKGMNYGIDAFGGFETVATELAPRLVARGHSVTIYCRRNLYKTHDFPEEFKGVRLRFIGSIERKNLGTMTNSLMSILFAIKERFDLVMLFSLGPGVFVPLLKLFGIKVVTQLDGVEWERSKWGALARIMFKVGAFFNVRYADELIADANEIRRIYSDEYRRTPIMIPYGAEIRDDLDSSYIRQNALEPGGYFLLVTRFVPENYPLFVIQSYLQSGIRKPLVVLGFNYYDSKYEDEIKKIKDNRVKFIGHITDRCHLYEFYRFSYCYIHAHSVGGTNPTMLEALANSCCIVALETPFNVEMLDKGKYGLFFELDSIDLVKKIRYIDAHPEVATSLRNKSRERIYSYYNWDFVTNQYVDLLNSLASKAVIRRAIR
jgi:glycosyltransferase involved in cell wall biosynthesis